MRRVRTAAACAITLQCLTVPGPASADPSPRLGMYCAPAGYGVPITISAGGHAGIDGLDCSGVRFSQGRVRAARCYANGGSIVTLNEQLTVTPDGSIRFNDTSYRYIGVGKTFRDCP